MCFVQLVEHQRDFLRPPTKTRQEKRRKKKKETLNNFFSGNHLGGNETIDDHPSLEKLTFRQLLFTWEEMDSESTTVDGAPSAVDGVAGPE